MSLNEIDHLLTLAKKAALAAGKIISENKDKEIKVQDKDGGENLASCVVTEVDFKAQEAILSVLNPINEKLSIGLLTEESDDDYSRFKKDYFWCIDPLDGTLAFSKKEYGFSVSISLVSKNGEAILGVVYDPLKDNLYYTTKESQSFKNNDMLKKTNQENLTLYFDKSYENHKNFKEHISWIEDNISHYGFKKLLLNPLGGAVMNAISVIEDSPAFYFKFPKKSLGGGSLWDFAATSIIIQNAGGYVSDFEHNKLNLNKRAIFMNDCGIIYASSKNLTNLIPKEF